MATAASTWPSLLAGRKAKASEVESKFDWLQTNLYPHNGGNLTDSAYDIGTAVARWSSIYTRSLNGTTTAAGVAIGKTTADANTCLDLSAMQKAMYLPILTTTERNALTPQAGFIIFNSTNSRMERYEGGQWLAMNNPIGMVAKVSVNATTAYSSLLSVAGTGRLVSLHFKANSAGNVNSASATLILDGVTYSIASAVPINANNNSRLVKTEATSTTLSFDAPTTGTWTQYIPLDINFKSTLDISVNAYSANTLTAYAIYEIA